MSIVATAPVLVPLATAGLTALFSGRSRTQQAISFVGVLGFLGAAVTLLAQVSASGPVGVSFGDWPAPYGIQFRFDGLSTAGSSVSNWRDDPSSHWPVGRGCRLKATEVPSVWCAFLT